MVKYLVGSGWSYGDQEMFTRQEISEKFDFEHGSPSPARLDMEKGWWVNHQYLKITDPAVIAPEFDGHLRRIGVDPANGPDLSPVIEQQRERCRSLVEKIGRASCRERVCQYV